MKPHWAFPSIQGDNNCYYGPKLKLQIEYNPGNSLGLGSYYKYKQINKQTYTTLQFNKMKFIESEKKDIDLAVDFLKKKKSFDINDIKRIAKKFK